MRKEATPIPAAGVSPVVSSSRSAVASHSVASQPLSNPLNNLQSVHAASVSNIQSAMSPQARANKTATVLLSIAIALFVAASSLVIYVVFLSNK